MAGTMAGTMASDHPHAGTVSCKAGKKITDIKWSKVQLSGEVSERVKSLEAIAHALEAKPMT